MKKLYFFALTIFALGQTNAQTTYTLTQANNEPVINETYDSDGIDTTNALPMSISGTNVTWNVTGISKSGVLNTTNYVDPTADANASNYPGTTIVQADVNATTYFKSSTNLYELLGVDAGMFNLNYNTDPATVAVYPITMGYINNDVASGAITASTLSGTFSSTIQTTADGTGTLSLTDANGTYDLTNCIRLKTKQFISFSLAGGFVTGTMDQVIYNFYNSTSKFPLFQVTYVNINAPNAGINNQRQDQVAKLSSIDLGLNDSKNNNAIFRAYPNPANNEVSLHFVLTQTDSYSIEITNTLGQVVKSVSMKNLQPGIYNETINLSGLTAGMYNVKVSGNKVQGTEKLIIQ